MKKTLIIITAVIACVIVAIAGLILAYTRSSDYTADHLPLMTKILSNIRNSAKNILDKK